MAKNKNISTQSNDKLILKLQDLISDKRDEISNEVNYTGAVWKTKCSIIDGEGHRRNLHVLGKEHCRELLAWVLKQSYFMKEADSILGISTEDVKLQGDFVSDWISDIQTRYMNVERIAKQNQLKEMEAMLKNLMSEETRTSQELDTIMNKLKNL